MSSNNNNNNNTNNNNNHDGFQLFQRHVNRSFEIFDALLDDIRALPADVVDRWMDAHRGDVQTLVTTFMVSELRRMEFKSDC